MREIRNNDTGSRKQEIPVLARMFLPTLGNLTLILIIYLIFSHLASFLKDGDTGFHIKAGDIIRQTGSLIRHDPFSFTMPGKEWFAWEWLSEVFMSFIHSSFGLGGVVGAFVILLCLVFVFVYHWMIARGAHALVAMFFTILAAIVTSLHWLARPHLFSLGFLLLVTAVLEDYRRNRTRWIYCIPVLIVLWVNMHAAFVIVFPIMILYAAGESVGFLRRREWNTTAAQTALRTYLIVFLLTAGASLLNPFGWGLHRHIWETLTDPTFAGSIQEYVSPDFHTIEGKLVELLLFIGAVTVYQAARKQRWIDIGLVVLWSHLMLQSVRHIPLAAIIILPLAAEHWSTLIHDYVQASTKGKTKENSILLVLRNRLRDVVATSERLSGIPLYIACAIFLCFLMCSPWANRIYGSDFHPDRHPIKAVEFMASHEIEGNIYAPDEYGDYLIYHLYPQRKVFIDSRLDFYRTGPVYADYKKLLKTDPSWKEILNKYDIEWMLLPEGDPLGLVALTSNEWKQIYKDEESRLLARK